ncbi:VP5 [Micromonas pusilla reovirus]|uniref:Putative outer capsid protein VP5 n=1 Tax=Micromonas pusilla reovirus (isolate Netherlands/2005) TaxID=649596 RepID=VP5_MPRVN|nr:VP5 [Micromonas pusilla reovirus]Q1I0U7.1 RecName: Full=Putative outer capsid protein VP5 [Micromonas pusilla reovirus (isolate Netherlands)]AAZ94045.1 VP5 [Micromonas pusilla reovirus]
MSSNATTRDFATTVAKALIAPGVCDTHGMSYPSIGAPKQLITVHGNASMTTDAGVTSVVAYLDPLSFRSGQLTATLVGRNGNLEPIQSTQVDIGTASSDFSAGSVLSLAITGENTSGDDSVSGTVAAGVTHDLIDDAQAMSHAKLERQTEYKDFVYKSAREGAVNAVAITPYLQGGSAYVGRGASTNKSSVKSVYTAGASGGLAALGFPAGLDGTATSGSTLTEKIMWHAKNVTADKARFLNGAAKVIEFDVSLASTAASTSTGAPPINYVIEYVDSTSETGVMVPAGAASAHAAFAAGRASFSITKPIKDIILKTSQANSQAVSSLVVSVTEQYECADIPEAPRAFVVFEGLKPGTSIVSVRCAATLAVTPSPENVSLMHRAPISTDVDYSLFFEFMTAFTRDAPMAFTPESRTQFLTMFDSPTSMRALQLAFDFDRGFRTVGRGLRNFARAAKETRHQASQIAKKVDPIFVAIKGEDIPFLSDAANLGHLAVRGAQRTTMLEAASYM